MTEDVQQSPPPISNRQLQRMVRKINLSDNHAILLKSGSAVARLDVVEEIRKIIRTETELTGVVVLVVDDFNDVRSIDERKMNAFGWYRRKRRTYGSGNKDSND